MKRPWLAAVLNFFFMGPGTFYNGRRKAVGALLTLGALGLTYAESQLQTAAPGVFPFVFVSVFVINTALAYDGYKEAGAINQAAQAP